ncbi:NADH-quinone oxidoreductase subunit NuoH [candidate division KSB1 bacterium]
MSDILINPFYSLLKLVPGINGLSSETIFVLGGIVAAVAMFLLIAVFTLIAVWLERKVSAHIQDRLGPMETGWHGALQTLADVVKLFMKEDIIPGLADRKMFVAAPVIVFMAAIAVFVVMPFSETFIISDLNIGIVYILAISGLVVPGIIMAGWGSYNKWSLFGAMRSAAQIVSYEIPVGLVIVCAVMVAGSLSMQDIVRVQEGGFWNWLIFSAPPFNFVAFIIYFIASIAEINRTPFDIPEAESELVAGYMTEYSGMRWAMFFLAEYGNMLAVSMIATTLFLGGWHAPFEFFGFIPGAVWFFSKTVILVLLQMWLRWTLPRLRVDQLMYVCWKVLIPFGFVCIIGVGIWQILS